MLRAIIDRTISNDSRRELCFRIRNDLEPTLCLAALIVGIGAVLVESCRQIVLAHADWGADRLGLRFIFVECIYDISVCQFLVENAADGCLIGAARRFIAGVYGLHASCQRQRDRRGDNRCTAGRNLCYTIVCGVLPFQMDGGRVHQQCLGSGRYILGSDGADGICCRHRRHSFTGDKLCLHIGDGELISLQRNLGGAVIDHGVVCDSHGQRPVIDSAAGLRCDGDGLICFSRLTGDSCIIDRCCTAKGVICAAGCILEGNYIGQINVLCLLRRSGIRVLRRECHAGDVAAGLGSGSNCVRCGFTRHIRRAIIGLVGCHCAAERELRRFHSDRDLAIVRLVIVQIVRDPVEIAAGVRHISDGGNAAFPCLIRHGFCAAVAACCDKGDSIVTVAAQGTAVDGDV